MKKFTSFSELGKAMGVKPKARKDAPAVKCVVCGAEMRNVPGTNVYLCTGKNDEGEDCGRYICKSSRRTAQGAW